MMKLLQPLAIPFVQWYIPAGLFYFFVMNLGGSVFLLSILLGFANAFVTEPLIHILSHLDEEPREKQKPSAKKVLTKILISVGISFIIVGIYHYFSALVFPVVLDAFSFGLIFLTLSSLLDACWKARKKSNELDC